VPNAVSCCCKPSTTERTLHCIRTSSLHVLVSSAIQHTCYQLSSAVSASKQSKRHGVSPQRISVALLYFCCVLGLTAACLLREIHLDSSELQTSTACMNSSYDTLHILHQQSIRIACCNVVVIQHIMWAVQPCGAASMLLCCSKTLWRNAVAKRCGETLWRFCVYA
jgi:hypothetical protein